MPTDEQLALGPPKVSFSNWMMGGDLVMVPWKPHTLAPHKRMELTTVENNKQIVKRHPKTVKPAGEKRKELEKIAEKKEEKKAEHEDGGLMGFDFTADDATSDTPKPDEWTTERDAQLVGHKLMGKSFKEIASIMGLSKKEVHDRYKEVGPDEHHGNNKEDNHKHSKDNHNNSKDTPKDKHDEKKDSSDWIGEQDAKILSMKDEDRKSWGEIASALGGGKSKKDVQHRYKELKEAGATADPPETSTENPWGPVNTSSYTDNENPFTNPSTTKNDNKSWNSSPALSNGGSGWAEVPKSVDNTKVRSNHNNGNRTSNNGNKNAWNKELVELKPDNLWNPHDVALLNMINAKYEENRLLHMSASFFNMTGRMVSVDLLKAKFESG